MKTFLLIIGAALAIGWAVAKVLKAVAATLTVAV